MRDWFDDTILTLLIWILDSKELKLKRKVRCSTYQRSGTKDTRVSIKSQWQVLSTEKIRSSTWTQWDPAWKIEMSAEMRNTLHFRLACKLQCTQLSNVKHSNFQTTPKFRSQLSATQDTEWVTSRRTFMERTTATALFSRKWSSAWPSEPIPDGIIGRTW